VSRIKRLVQSYANYIAVPWRDDAAAAQRVVFCVYHETEELRLRAKVDEFEIATRASGHNWALFDLTDTFPNWLASQRYAKSYFQKPNLLSTRKPQPMRRLPLQPMATARIIVTVTRNGENPSLRNCSTDRSRRAPSHGMSARRP